MMSKLYCGVLRQWRGYHIYRWTHYDNEDVYTCLCEPLTFALRNLANVQYAYELVGRDLN